MFNHITLKYAALVAAAYGMSLSDIGLGTTSASGETLAGSIRQERRTRKTGHARTKTKAKWFFDQILPPTLEFNWIDYDDELNVALGRARLATSQAFASFRMMGLFSPQELRSQSIVDGLVSISLPDELPPDAKPEPPVARTVRYEGEKDNDKGGNTEPELIGNPKAPSGGGEGDIKKSLDTVSFKPKIRNLNTFVQSVVSEFAPFIFESLSTLSEDDVEVMRSMFIEEVTNETDELGIYHSLSELLKSKSLGTFEFGDLETELASLLGEGYEHVNLKKYADRLKANIKSRVGDFLGRAALVTTMLSNVEPDGLIDDVVQRVNATLPDYIYAFVNIEAKSIVDEILNTPSSLPEVIRMKSLPKPRKEVVQPITINLPEQKSQINVDVPPSNTDVTVNVPAQEASIVNVASPIVNIEQEPPVVNVAVPERANTIQVNMPEQPVSVVNVNVPEQLAPVVNIAVEPTPVEIKNTVNVPKDKRDKKKITLRKDGNTWTGEATDS